MRSLLLVESLDFRPSNQYILVREIPSCLHFAKMRVCHVNMCLKLQELKRLAGVNHIVEHFPQQMASSVMYQCAEERKNVICGGTI
jgi:hypothetical protein